MKYFKNTELAKLYNVSEKSVRNWIDAAQAGKLDLQLYKVNDKEYIANTTKNGLLVTELANKGKKYKNSRGVKKLHPKKAFYELYNERQIIDIISNLTIHHESPLQYTYVDGGAEDWNKYASRLLNEQAPNMLKRSIELIEMTAASVDRLLEKYEKVNVIDLGPGNGLPVKPTLRRLLKEKRLNKYVPIDISNDMLAIVERNIKTWFGDSITVDAQNHDFSYERFNKLLANNFTENNTANIVFLLGGTLANFRSPEQVLQTINSSLGPNDVFIYTGYLDTPKTRRYFDYYTSDRKVPVQDGLILDLLNIDESLYDVEQKFDEHKLARSISIRPTVDLSIIFDIYGSTHSIEIPKNESILVWRHWHKNIVEMINMFDRNDFDVMQAIKSSDGQHVLIVSKIKTTEN
jgi:SAM-dependent methyltransferase